MKEYDFLQLSPEDRTNVVDGYMRRACARFGKICKYDITNGDDTTRTFDIDIPDDEIDDIADIVSEGMVVQWFKPYFYKQENYENIMNTVDYSSYSPAELLYRITSAYKMSKKDFANLMKDYSYDNGDLSDLHL